MWGSRALEFGRGGLGHGSGSGGSAKRPHEEIGKHESGLMVTTWRMGTEVLSSLGSGAWRRARQAACHKINKPLNTESSVSILFNF